MSSTMESRGTQGSAGTTGSTHPSIHHLATSVERNLAVSSKPGAWQVVAARPGDHHLACQLLASVQRGPSASEFQAQLDDPYYEPTDRLLCRANELLVGHVRLVKREMRFGSATLPVTSLADLLVLPEYRQQGCGSGLLAAAEQVLEADGSYMGIIRTQHPQFYLRRGWCVWTRHSYSTAGAREILSQLLESRSDNDSDSSSTEAPPISIRLWRHIELTGMVRLYGEKTRQAFGPLVRSDAYWQWLLSRRAFDRIYVAIRGPDRFELDEGAAAMVGYAVMKEGRILELMALPNDPHAARQLLARACSDTIEQDGNYVRLDAPVEDPLHHLIARAGGELGFHESVQGEVCLVKVLDLSRALGQLDELLHDRAKSAGLALPLELGFHVGGEKYCLEFRPRSAKLRVGRSCRSYLRCGQAELTQLLLGHLDVRVAVAAGRIVPSTRTAVETAAVLFPKLPLWRPPWDEIPAK